LSFHFHSLNLLPIITVSHFYYSPQCTFSVSHSFSEFSIFTASFHLVLRSDVKRGRNLEAEAEAKALRPRPELRGRGQDYEVEAKAEAKNNCEKSTK